MGDALMMRGSNDASRCRWLDVLVLGQCSASLHRLQQRAASVVRGRGCEGVRLTA